MYIQSGLRQRYAVAPWLLNLYMDGVLEFRKFVLEKLFLFLIKKNVTVIGSLGKRNVGIYSHPIQLLNQDEPGRNHLG